MKPTSEMADVETMDMDVNTDDSGSLSTVASKEESGQQWDNIKNTVVDILSELPDYVGGFFNQYQKPIVTVTLLIAVLVTIKVTFAVVDAVNEIPLLSPIFELVGMGYSIWFIYRYMLRASTRQELWQEINGIKSQYLGAKDE
ncbi:CAAD domain-containing protein [Planktothricoides sp. FACHB-1370]|uniref:CAAD domain-containing protein n=2 Tax=Oscillatoriaceae TaxID=1892254 RepID=A0ABR8EFI5_9CYAN|nr:CAAD domain-containing protein [Planktothricoides raciborskii FACHB-1370]MBD2583666.1 CAAD domain-containing protein [Planktothricoides raciborskii FACHB-1261]